MKKAIDRYGERIAHSYTIGTRSVRTYYAQVSIDDFLAGELFCDTANKLSCAMR